MKILYTFISLALPFSIKAQDHSDCSTAIEILYPQTLTIPPSYGSGSLIEDVAPPCDIIELSSTWFTFSFDGPGLFYFTITPVRFVNDIDFVLSQSLSGNCDMYLPVRCMGIGENTGGDIDSNCLGPTGLSLFATDLIGHPGCLSTDDNFLAALEVNKGELYYLMVLDYFHSSDSSGYTIEFMSTAPMSGSVGLNEKFASKQKTSLYPNPALDQINLVFSEDIKTDVNIQIVDTYGRIRIESNFVPPNPISIDTKNLESGIYNVLIFSENNFIEAISFTRQ